MLDDLINERRKKLDAIRGAGIDPYPARVERSFAIAHALEHFEKLAAEAKQVSLVGRIRGIRDQGKILFADLEDESGQIQIVIKEDSLSGEGDKHDDANAMGSFDFIQSVIDLGDFVAVSGPLFTTKKGEKSVEVQRFTMAAKSMLPLPDKWDGIENDDIRLRKRYLDLVTAQEVREMFRKKTRFWETIRGMMKHEGFLEVETPILENLPGGAEAEPFKTHHNALDEDFYLRISLELPLKKLLVGGFEGVFEIGRIFRNEGIDREHLQDYTQMEFYWAYRDYHDAMTFTEQLYKATVKNVCGDMTTEYDGVGGSAPIKIDWSKKWKHVDYVEAFKDANDGIDPTETTREELLKKAKELNLEVDKTAGKGRLIDLIYKKTVRPNLIEPCFLINPPVEIEPLAKRHADNPKVVERFQIVAAGTELGKGFSELNDPEDQRARFEEQMKLREAGDAEAQHLDEDFLEAMSYGMPPAAGFGMSERFFAVLMNKPIRETVFFPLMRKKK